MASPPLPSPTLKLRRSLPSSSSFNHLCYIPQRSLFFPVASNCSLRLRGTHAYFLALPACLDCSLPTLQLRRPRPSSSPSSAAATSDGSIDPLDDDKDRRFREWDSLTAKFAGAANLPFLLLQIPQILLNSRNLLSGNKTALFAIPWLGMLTGLLGNLSLLSYFAKKKETEAMVVQTLGVISTYVVIVQLTIAEAMPLPQFVATSTVVVAGLVVNFLNYLGWIQEGVWRLWEDFITIGGLSILPQVMWSTFVPCVPNSILPGSISFILAVLAVTMARSGKLSEEGTKFVGSISGWTATLLFMWMPVAQMWTNYLNPDNIKGLSAFSMLLAMIGNGLMIPRAVFIRDFMWFTGSTWGSFLQGLGNLFCMYCFKVISREFFMGATLGYMLWIGLSSPICTFTICSTIVILHHRGYSTAVRELIFNGFDCMFIIFDLETLVTTSIKRSLVSCHSGISLMILILFRRNQMFPA